MYVYLIQHTCILNYMCVHVSSNNTCARTFHWIGGLTSSMLSERSWWRHQMETFSVLQALCTGKSPVTGMLPSQRPVKWSFDVFFDLRLNKRLSKQSRRQWFETSSRSSWRHCDVHVYHANPVSVSRRQEGRLGNKTGFIQQQATWLTTGEWRMKKLKLRKWILQMHRKLARKKKC